MDYNFTFTNPLVKEFFTGKSKEPSEGLISMYQFLHEHPLLKPSFLTVIKDELEKTHKHLLSKKIKSQIVIQPLIDATIGVANNLPNDNPKKGLMHLRDLYNASIKLQSL